MIRVIPLLDGRHAACIVGSPSVGVETSFASLDRGEDQVEAAIAALRRLYDRLPYPLPVQVADQAGAVQSERIG